MGLDIRIKQRKNLVCPDCGKIVGSVDVLEESSGGRVWYEFLKSVSYYVPDAEIDEWYGKDMVLTKEQVQALYRFTKDMEPLNWYEVMHMLAVAMAEGHDVAINADW